MEAHNFPLPSERPDLWPWALRAPEDTTQADILEWTIGGESLRDIAAVHVDNDRPLIIQDTQDLDGQLNVWATAFFEEFWDGYGMGGAQALYRGWATGSPRYLHFFARHGLAVECDSAEQIPPALEAGINAALLRVDINEQTAELLRSNSELGGALALYRPEKHEGKTVNVPQDLILDLRGIAYESADIVPSLVEDLSPFVGLCIDIPHATRRDNEDYRAAVSAGIRLLADMGGRHLILTEETLPSGAEPVGATTVARAIASMIREECESHGVKVPTVDYQPAPSVIAHSLLKVHLTSSRCWPMAGDNVSDSLLLWR